MEGKEHVFTLRRFVHGSGFLGTVPFSAVLNRVEIGATRIRAEMARKEKARKEAAGASNSDKIGDIQIDTKVEQSTAAA